MVVGVKLILMEGGVGIWLGVIFFVFCGSEGKVFCEFCRYGEG